MNHPNNLYSTIAKAMKDSKPTGVMDQHVWSRVIHTLAHDLGVVNRRFNKKRFFAECGETKEE